jgi:two-component system phosphate regulon sensor histidine kinase PhoR
LSRRIGIFWKYFIVYSATATVVIFVLAGLMNVTIRKRYQEIISDELRRYALFAGAAFRTTFDGEPGEADRLAKDLGRQTGARVTLIMPDGTVLGDTEKDPTQMENHSERPEIKKALSGEIGTSIRYSTTLKEKMSYVAVPVVDDGEIRGVVRVSLRLQAVELLIKESTRRTVFLSIAIWVIALILTFLFSSVFSSSIKQMVSLTKRFAGGDLSKRAIVKSRDELGELAAGLNDMSQELQSLFEQLQTQRDELDAIIDSMSEGVLVLDRQLRVRLANNSFREMFSIEGDAQADDR